MSDEEVESASCSDCEQLERKIIYINQILAIIKSMEKHIKSKKGQDIGKNKLLKINQHIGFLNHRIREKYEIQNIKGKIDNLI